MAIGVSTSPHFMDAFFGIVLAAPGLQRRRAGLCHAHGGLRLDLPDALMFLVEVAAGVMAGSLSLQADALAFLGDAGNYVLSLWGCRGPSVACLIMRETEREDRVAAIMATHEADHCAFSVRLELREPTQSPRPLERGDARGQLRKPLPSSRAEIPLDRVHGSR